MLNPEFQEGRLATKETRLSVDDCRVGREGLGMRAEEHQLPDFMIEFEYHLSKVCTR